MSLSASRSHSLRSLRVFGMCSATLYAVLLLFEQPILAWSTRGGWYFIIPVAIAFLFSWVHGQFTAAFWDTLGIQAKQ
ncbi:MAG: hypothetical protein G8237_05630 [Magnetococcales bacterium]|nr:hypothetical protein [Magnetococcales bacterium]